MAPPRGLASTLNAIAVARWMFALASLLATLVLTSGPQAAGIVVAVALVAGNLAVLRGLQGEPGQRDLKRLAWASLLLDSTAAVVWLSLEAGRQDGAMWATFGLVGVEAAALFSPTVTLVFMVAIIAVLGGADAIDYALFGLPIGLPTTIIRVSILWAIVILARVLLPGSGRLLSWQGGEGKSDDDELASGKFQEVLDGAPSAIIAADGEGQVMMVNAAALRLFDHTRREITGKPAGQLVPGLYDDLPHGSGARYLTKEVSAAGKGRSWEGIRRDGSRFPAEVSYSTLQLGRQVLVAASVRDITDRIKAEQERDAYKAQLEEAQRLESLGRLAGGIAHDFNNMLNVILNYTDFVEEATKHDPTITSDLGEIRSAGKRAARLTQQLLRLAGREALRPEAVDLQDEVSAMAGRLRSLLGPDGRLQVAIPRGLPRVMVDPTMINEVLGILVDNAVHAMPRGGEVAIDAVERMVNANQAAQQPDLSPGTYVVMGVTDTGEGMDEETRNRALEPFFSTRATLGGGLGLPTAYGLVRQSGGTLVIQSQKGRGTTVEVYMPAATSDAAMLASVSAGAGPDGTMPAPRPVPRDQAMVLVMDHDDVTRTAIADKLIRNNFEVVEARDGADALKVAVEEQGRIKVVIVDRVMGSMLDTGLPEMLKSLLPDARMILMSTFSRQVLSSQGLDVPDLPFLSKDASESELIAKVGEVLSNAAAPGRPR